MKKGIIISIIAVIVLTAIACIALSNTYFSPYEKQIRLAYKYLEEGNYEEAILAFDKAIQIDAKKPKAYIGKADVYITRCDENAIADATAVLKLGYEQSEDNRDKIVKAVIRLSDTLKENGQEQLAYEFSKIMYEIISDEKIADWMVEFIEDYVESAEEPDNKFFVDTFKEIYNITKNDKLIEWLKNYAEKTLNDTEEYLSTDIVNLLEELYKNNDDSKIKELLEQNKAKLLNNLKDNSKTFEDENFVYSYISDRNGWDAKLKETATGNIVVPESYAGIKVLESICTDNSNITAFIMPDGATELFGLAKGCSNVEVLYIPKSARVDPPTTVLTFKGAAKLTDIYYEGSPEEFHESYPYLQYYDSRDGQYHINKSVHVSIGSKCLDDVNFHFNQAREDVIKILGM